MPDGLHARDAVDSPVVVIGAGGHAKVCVELLQAMGEVVECCVGDSESDVRVGIPVRAGDGVLSELRERGVDRAFVAIGDNQARLRVGAEVRSLGFRLVNAISPAAVISPTARLGEGIALMAGVVVNADATIHDFAIVNTGATVDHDCHIGTGVHLAPQCALAGNVTVGAGTFLGIGTRVIPGVTIGANASVGAGAVVISPLGAGVTAVGVPAQVRTRSSKGI